jgi:type II secretory pathway component PulF
MPYYDYSATDEQQNLVTGQIQTEDEQGARRQLEALGLMVVELQELAEAEVADLSTLWDEKSVNLDAATTRLLLLQILELQQSGCPLDSGLLAAAASTSNRRLARALRHIAARLQQGTTPDEIIASWSSRIPPHMLGLIAAIQRTGQGLDPLLRLMDYEQNEGDLRRRLWRSLAYPVTMLVLALILFVTALFVINRPMRLILEEFGLNLPPGVQMVFWWGDVGVWLILGGLLVIALFLLVCRAILPGEHWHLLISATPLVGVIHWWSGIASFFRLTGLLVQHNVPLPETLHLVEQAMSDASLKHVCGVARNRVQAGTTLLRSRVDMPRIPSLAISYVHGGERQGDLAKACEAAADLYEARAAHRLIARRQVAPPFIFLLILTLLLLMVTMIVLPILTLFRAFN